MLKSDKKKQMRDYSLSGNVQGELEGSTAWNRIVHRLEQWTRTLMFLLLPRGVMWTQKATLVQTDQPERVWPCKTKSYLTFSAASLFADPILVTWPKLGQSHGLHLSVLLKSRAPSGSNHSTSSVSCEKTMHRCIVWNPFVFVCRNPRRLVEMVIEVGPKLGRVTSCMNTVICAVASHSSS